MLDSMPTKYDPITVSWTRCRVTPPTFTIADSGEDSTESRRDDPMVESRTDNETKSHRDDFIGDARIQPRPLNYRKHMRQRNRKIQSKSDLSLVQSPIC